MAKEYTQTQINQAGRCDTTCSLRILRKAGHKPVKVITTAKRKYRLWGQAALDTITEWRSGKDFVAAEVQPEAEREPIDLDVAQQVTTQLLAVSERLDQTVTALREVVRHVHTISATQNGTAIQVSTTQDLVTAMKRTLDEVLEVITAPKETA